MSARQSVYGLEWRRSSIVFVFEIRRRCVARLNIPQDIPVAGIVAALRPEKQHVMLVECVGQRGSGIAPGIVDHRR